MVERSGTQSPKGTTTTLYEVVIYTMWNIWKERNRRIFQGMAMNARQVALKAKEDIDTRSRVLRKPDLAILCLTPVGDVLGVFFFLCVPGGASRTYRPSRTYNFFSFLRDRALAMFKKKVSP